MTKEKIEQVKNSIARSLRYGRIRSAKYLAWVAVVEEKSDTYPRTRAVIKEMIEDGELIGSNAKGYFYMQDAHEIQRYMNSLMKRQIGIGNRIQAVFNAGVAKGILK
jgi:hypothetical protein